MNKIVCFSAGGGQAIKNFNNTVLNNIDISKIKDFLEFDNKDYNQFSIWGMKDTNRSKCLWEKLNEGDIVLFYYRTKFISYGRIIKTDINSYLAQDIWGNVIYKYLIIMEPHKEINSHRGKFWEAFNYSNYATVNGTLIPRMDLQERIIKKYDGLENFLNYALS
ncbi:hypothetical protein M3182_04570 [Mesobacillus maritimus]|uniref:hypothetical protein n=1 Tax=Mesobacillus maritimus TaxID=1643336 RepID=UPI002040318E|nr:hypothetical protein [Mesobacillus maritimus]MCM3585020.1 hypothetical protein [Mesobacillus maritimus]